VDFFFQFLLCVHGCSVLVHYSFVPHWQRFTPNLHYSSKLGACLQAISSLSINRNFCQVNNQSPRCFLDVQGVILVFFLKELPIDVTIVNRGEWLWNSTKFFAVYFCSLFWPRAYTKHNSCLLLIEELTNRNI